MKKTPAFVTLMLIALVAALLLAATDRVTREPIQRVALAATNAARIAVFPDADDFVQVEPPQGLNSLYEAKKGGQTVGRVATVTTQGFAGAIEVTLGLDADQKLTGLTVGGTSFAETAGLGSKAQEPAFTDQFMGKAVPVSLGTDVDAISGATITSRAVVNGINQAAGVLGVDVSAAQTEADTASHATSEAVAQPSLTPEELCQKAFPDADGFEAATAPEGVLSLYAAKKAGADVGQVATASAQGFGGPVEVTVGLDLSGSIAGLYVGGKGFAETAGFGAKAQEAAFTDQFMGKTTPLSYGSGVDAISGATITSDAVMKALTAALSAMGK